MIQSIVEITLAIFLLVFIVPKVEVKIKREFVNPNLKNELQIKKDQVLDKAKKIKGKIPREVKGVEIPKAKREAVVDTAKKYLGVRYDFGGTSIETGIDCSFFVQLVYGENGIRLPRTAATQYARSTEIEEEQLKSGDLVFFQTYTIGPSHVGIAINNHKFIHASSLDGKVVISELSDPFYKLRYIGARRILC